MITVPDDPVAPSPDRIYRHRLPVRIWHWLNAVTLLILLMSGLMIFNAHPRLYWGEYGANDDPAWLAIGSTPQTGFLRIGDTRIETTGLLGRWTDAQGVERTWAFPGWATIPTSYDLASGRRWHLFFAWVLAISLTLFMLWTAFGGHLKRDLHVRRAEWSPRHIGRDIRDHARLRFAKGAEAARYGILQKLSYIGVIFVLLPLMIFTGLAMSPGMNAAWPWLIDIFGGRQSARSIHFIAAWLLVAFTLMHIVMVLLTGPVNQLRAMLTGWFRPPPEKAE